MSWSVRSGVWGWTTTAKTTQVRSLRKHVVSLNLVENLHLLSLNLKEDRQEEQESHAGACPKQSWTEPLHDREKLVSMINQSEEHVGVIFNQFVFLGDPFGPFLLRLSTKLTSALKKCNKLTRSSLTLVHLTTTAYHSQPQRVYFCQPRRASPYLAFF